MNVTTSKPTLIGLAAAILVILIFLSSYPDVKAQNATTFTTLDMFNIPELNGSIRFALNGSYSSATLENGTWTFNDLQLNDSYSLGSFKLSVENSSVTILSFRSDQNFSRTAFLRYDAQGTGKQTVNLCLNSSQLTHLSEWGVSQPGTFLAEGDKWKLMANNTVVVLGLTGNVTVSHYSFNVSEDSNLPFYQRHSIVIITVTLLAVAVAVALAVRFRMRK